MTKITFESFIQSYPNYQSLQNDIGAKKVFELLNQEKSIVASIKATEEGEPALLPHMRVIEYLLNYCGKSTLDLNNDFHKMCIGKMQCVIMKALGYEPTEDKKIPEWSSNYIKKAMCYTKNDYEMKKNG